MKSCAYFQEMVQDRHEQRLLMNDAILFDGEDVTKKSFLERHSQISTFSAKFDEEILKKKNVFPFLLYCKKFSDLLVTGKLLHPDWQKKLLHKCNGVVFHAMDRVRLRSYFIVALGLNFNLIVQQNSYE